MDVAVVTVEIILADVALLNLFAPLTFDAFNCAAKT